MLGDVLKMNNYENAMQAMNILFARDYQFALATSSNDIPTVRFVDTFYYKGCFYVVTYKGSNKMKDIEKNCNVSLTCRRLHSFQAEAENIGHPLDENNYEIREKLISAFEPWYFVHNNENDDNMCYLKIKPLNGFFHLNGTGYKMDFKNKTADSFDFIPTIKYTKE